MRGTLSFVTGKCAQKIAKILRNKQSVVVRNAASFNPGKKFERERFWSRTVQLPLSLSASHEINKHLITLVPKIYPFFSKSLSKIWSANGLGESYLPEGKIYMSRTTGRGFFRALRVWMLLYTFPMIRSVWPDILRAGLCSFLPKEYKACLLNYWN